jgi:hypothetical protein
VHEKLSPLRSPAQEIPHTQPSHTHNSQLPHFNPRREDSDDLEERTLEIRSGMQLKRREEKRRLQEDATELDKKLQHDFM